MKETTTILKKMQSMLRLQLHDAIVADITRYTLSWHKPQFLHLYDTISVSLVNLKTNTTHSIQMMQPCFLHYDHIFCFQRDMKTCTTTCE